METSAVLFATAAAADGGPAAALPVDGGTIVGRLLDQLGALGVRRVWVVTRPEWTRALEESAGWPAGRATVVASEDVSSDLRTTAELASAVSGPVVLGSAHVLGHGEALARLVADPRAISAVLTASSPQHAAAFPLRSARGRVVSAASPHHRVRLANGYLLGLAKIDPRDRSRLVAAARELAELASASIPEGWDELDRKTEEWRRRAESESEVELRREAARDDVVALLLVGLVRAGTAVAQRPLRGFFYAAPLSRRAADDALEEMSGYDEERIALDSAVKAKDGFFTTFLVSPYSKYLARFAARRGWSPNAVTTVSFALGIAAACAFAVGARSTFVAGALLLQVAFVVDCVDGQLARYTRAFSRFGAWLDSLLDRCKEYIVYAGLAVGATRAFGDDVWTLAAVAVALQTFRHITDFAYLAARPHALPAAPPPLDEPDDERAEIGPTPAPPALEGAGGTAVAARPTPRVVLAAPAHRPEARRAERRRAASSTLARLAAETAGALERRSWTRWGKRILVLPIGERFALISLTAALSTPRVTFLVLLAWGSLAAAYAFAGRVLLALAR